MAPKRRGSVSSAERLAKRRAWLWPGARRALTYFLPSPRTTNQISTPPSEPNSPSGQRLHPRSASPSPSASRSIRTPTSTNYTPGSLGYASVTTPSFVFTPSTASTHSSASTPCPIPAATLNWRNLTDSDDLGESNEAGESDDASSSLSKATRRIRKARKNGKPKTTEIFLDFQKSYHLHMPTKQFIGLCAYLYNLLALGFELRTQELDSFICRYPEYLTQLRVFEQQQISTNCADVISYHGWFLQSSSNVSAPEQILTEQSLREISNEYPLQFEISAHRMDCIARIKRRQLQV